MPSSLDGLVKQLANTWKNYSAKLSFSDLPMECILSDKSESIPIQFKKKGFDLVGNSICGDDTALLTEKGRIGLDAGASSGSLPLPDHLFISHHHDDHIIGLRTLACRSAEEEKKVDVYLGRDLPEVTLNWIRLMEEKNPNIGTQFHFVDEDDVVDIDGNTKLEFFRTNHSQGSLGVSIMKKKRNGKFENYITYTGDINLRDPEMRKEPHLHSAKNLIVESSYLGNELSKPLYESWGHSSFQDVKQLLDEREKKPKSLTTVHLPYTKGVMLTCDRIEKELEGSRSRDVGYIPSCFEEGTNPMEPRNRRKI